MKKHKWGGVPPKTQQLPDGRTRVYFNAVPGTEISPHYDEEGNLVEEEEIESYSCSSVDMEGPVTYERLIEALIRDRYTVSDELAILRQQASKPEEFEAYNLYAEECKQIAKSITQE